MNFTKLKQDVLDANQSLVTKGLVILTWGNVSQIDETHQFVAIKPSGVPYHELTLDSIVVTDLDGRIIEGHLKPSSDLPTHLEIYKAYKDIKGITHTHSKWGTIYAQAGKSISMLGTTHADHFRGMIPCTRFLTKEEVDSAYEKNTGLVIIETLKDINPLETPGILCAGHAPFTFGLNAKKSVENALVLEYIAEMAFYTKSLNENAQLPAYFGNLHYNRKHGKNAYYGQMK